MSDKPITREYPYVGSLARCNACLRNFSLDESIECPHCEIASLRQQLADEQELHRMQMAGISIACMMNTRKTHLPLPKEHSYWTPAYQDAIDTVCREMEWREKYEAEKAAKELAVAEAVREIAAKLSANGSFNETHTVSQFSPAAIIKQAEDNARDAERYQHLRKDPSMLLHLSNKDFDAAIDAAKETK